MAPNATISPHLESLITHQLMQRVNQEAELLCKRAQTGALVRTVDVQPVALLQETERILCRQWTPGLRHVPTYALPRLMQDARLRDTLLDHLTRASRTNRGWVLTSTDGIRTWHLQRHQHTTSMAVALWRLAAWNDSGAKLSPV